MLCLIVRSILLTLATTGATLKVILINYPDYLHGSQKHGQWNNPKLAKRGTLYGGHTLLLSFFSGNMHESSRNGATEHQHRRSPGFPRVGATTHQSGGDCRGQSLNLCLCGECTFPLCIRPFIPPPLRPLPPLKEITPLWRKRTYPPL